MSEDFEATTLSLKRLREQLDSQSLELRKAKVEIEELRKQRHELLISGNIRDDEMGLIQRYDLEIEAKKAEVK